MLRRKKGDLTIEMWTVKGKVVFEVSLKGKDTASDLKTFHNEIVWPLVAANVKPITESKTDLGSKC
ncbi:hypothetical protein FUT87_06505 [Mitsuaria sp. TWR114]|nr:hypothetical protein FUT87_06505 [Mitsuaria sp. TWR114]